MLDQEYETMRRVEDTHWWYRVFRESTVRAVRELTRDHPQARILDAGCGTGGTLARLKAENPAWQLSGLDLSPHAVRHTSERGIENVIEGDVAHLPYEDESMDGIVSLDVLYHRDVNEAAAIAEFLRVLKPGGFLVMNLPAFQFLTGAHDTAVNGVRRYTAARVRELLEPSGFAIARQQYWNAWLFLPLLGWRVLSRLHASNKAEEEVSSDLATLPTFANRLLAGFGRIDWALCRALRIPFGTSVFIVATKRTA